MASRVFLAVLVSQQLNALIGLCRGRDNVSPPRVRGAFNGGGQ